MNPSEEPSVWYAMSATFGRSLKAQKKLNERSIDTYVPMHYGVVRGRDGHKRKELLPVVSNLIFVNTTWSGVLLSKEEMPWLQMLTFPEEGRNVPIVVPQKQMEDFIAVSQHLSEEGGVGAASFLRPDELNLREGERVRIIGGPFNNVEGVFMNTRGKRKELIVEIPHIIAARTIIRDYDLIEVLPREDGEAPGKKRI